MKSSFHCLPLLILLLSSLSLARRSRAQQQFSPVPDFVVGGYLPDYRFYIDVDKAAIHLTDLILFSAKPTPSGMLTHFLSPSNFEAALSSRLQNPGLKLLMSVGGGGRSENFLAIASDAGRRQKFVRAVKAMCEK